MEDYPFVRVFDGTDPNNLYIQQQEDTSSMSHQISSLLTFSNQIGHGSQSNDNNDDFSLGELLQEWGLEELKSYLIQQKISVHVLKIIKRHHLEKLFKDIPMGIQIIFEHRLENWRETMGNPLDKTLQNQLDLINFEEQPYPSPSGTSTPTSTSSAHPYLRPKTPDAGATISLGDVLNTVKGRMLCSFYETKKQFDEEQRNNLINLISQYFDEKQISMSLATSYQFEKEIIARFKTEKLEYYRTKKRGKLYNKCSNHKKITLEKVKKQAIKESRFTQDFVIEADAETCLAALKFENLSADEFDSHWKACAQYRLNDIKTMQTTAEIFQKWSFYKKPSGYRLIEIDYGIAFGGDGDLLNHWEKYFPRIVTFLQKDGHIKDKSAIALLEKALTDTNDENGKYASVLWAIHGYLVPSAKLYEKRNGKTTCTKYTIKDSQESFLFCGKTQQEIEEHIINLKGKKNAIQPFILCLGDDISKISNICVYFDDVRYKFFHLIKAVDVCLKIIYLFNLDFPNECKMFWNFIEKAFYGHTNVKLESPKVHMLYEYVTQ